MPPPPPLPPAPPAPRWTAARRVTFCLALAASGSVTFAAASAGLSRKSAYARKQRDAGFAACWDEALAAAAAAKNPRCQRRQGDEVEEVDDPPVSPGQGDRRDARRAAARAIRGPRPATAKMRLPAALRQARLGGHLAKRAIPSDAGKSKARLSAF